MGRPALDPQFKAARLEAARQEARRLNRRLPMLVNAFAMPSGKVYVRYEPTGGRKVTLTAAFPSPAFYEELAAVTGGGTKHTPRSTLPLPASQPEIGTWRAICTEFFTSSAFMRYSERDRRVRKNLLERTWVEPIHRDEPDGRKFGDMPMAKFRFKAITTLKERFAKIAPVPDAMFLDDRGKDRRVPTTPEAGNSVVRFIRLVFEWAKEHHTDLVEGRNWGREVKLYPSSNEGWKTWGPEQCEAYEAHHPVGTKARLVYDLAKLTGQRIADVARIGPSMMSRDRKGRDTISFIQVKGRNAKPVKAFVPVFPELRASIAAARSSGVLGTDTFVSTQSGGQYDEQSLGNYFRKCCKAAGIVGYSMHGLRKTGVVNLIEADCSFFEIMAITGHRSGKEVERYGREFMRAAAMESAFDKWLERHRHEAADDPEFTLAA